METLSLFKNSTDFEEFKTGETIFEAGSPATSMYVVQEGEVEIIVNERVVENAGPGDLFGEMALIDRKTRSATVKAKTDCRVVPVDEKRFMFLVQQTPFFALHVMKVMAARIRNMDALL